MFSLICVKTTNADFVYKKTIKNNQFSATTFDFSQLKTTNNSAVENLFNINGISPGGYEVNSLRIKNQGASKFNYFLSFEKVAGDDSFCRQLEINFIKDGQIQYKGAIVDLNFNDSLNQDKDYFDWLLYLKLNDNYLASVPNFCEFNLVITGFNGDPNQKSGFKYKRMLHNYVSFN